VEYELGGATEQLSKYGPHEITVVCKRRGEQAHGVVLGELERPVVRRKVRNWRTTLNPTDADLHFRKVVVAAVAGGEGTRPLIVKVDPAVATVRDIKKGVEQAWGIPPEEQQLYRQPKAWGEECGEDEGSVAADNEGVGEDGGYSLVRGLSNGAGQSSAEQSTGREEARRLKWGVNGWTRYMPGEGDWAVCVLGMSSRSDGWTEVRYIPELHRAVQGGATADRQQ
jgi:hypothetical protein